jgi:hypothetical protein
MLTYDKGAELHTINMALICMVGMGMFVFSHVFVNEIFQAFMICLNKYTVFFKITRMLVFPCKELRFTQLINVTKFGVCKDVGIFLCLSDFCLIIIYQIKCRTMFFFFSKNCVWEWNLYVIFRQIHCMGGKWIKTNKLLACVMCVRN